MFGTLGLDAESAILRCEETGLFCRLVVFKDRSHEGTGEGAHASASSHRYRAETLSFEDNGEGRSCAHLRSVVRRASLTRQRRLRRTAAQVLACVSLATTMRLGVDGVWHGLHRHTPATVM